jgi:hypothetical protein
MTMCLLPMVPGCRILTAAARPQVQTEAEGNSSHCIGALPFISARFVASDGAWRSGHFRVIHGAPGQSRASLSEPSAKGSRDLKLAGGAFLLRMHRTSRVETCGIHSSPPAPSANAILCLRLDLLQKPLRRTKAGERALGSPSGMAIPVPAANYPLCRFPRLARQRTLYTCVQYPSTPPIVIISALPAQAPSNHLLAMTPAALVPRYHGTCRDRRRYTCPAPPTCSSASCLPNT